MPAAALHVDSTARARPERRGAGRQPSGGDLATPRAAAHAIPQRARERERGSARNRDGESWGGGGEGTGGSSATARTFLIHWPGLGVAGGSEQGGAGQNVQPDPYKSS